MPAGRGTGLPERTKARPLAVKAVDGLCHPKSLGSVRFRSTKCVPARSAWPQRQSIITLAARPLGIDRRLETSRPTPIGRLPQAVPRPAAPEDVSCLRTIFCRT